MTANCWEILKKMENQTASRDTNIFIKPDAIILEKTKPAPVLFLCSYISTCKPERWPAGLERRRSRGSLKYSKCRMITVDASPAEKQIMVMCPVCHVSGALFIDKMLVEATLEQAGDSLLHLHVFQGDICDHAFSITVDAHLKVRASIKHPN